jgi:hypothetical protein
LLKIEPDSRAGAELTTHAKRAIRRDIALARQDLADPVGRDANRAGQLGGTHAELSQFVR